MMPVVADKKVRLFIVALPFLDTVPLKAKEYCVSTEQGGLDLSSIRPFLRLMSARK